MKFTTTTTSLLLSLTPLQVVAFVPRHFGRAAYGPVSFARSAAWVATITPSSSTDKPTANTQLRGILDEVNSDAYNLMSTGDETEVQMNEAYEVFLAEMVFSTNDPRVDIMNKIDLCSDPDFLEWLANKQASSNDPEERLALKDLLDMIQDITTRIQVNQLAEERAAAEQARAEAERVAEAEAAAEEGRKMTNADILKKAAEIDAVKKDRDGQSADNKRKTSFLDSELTPEIRLSYESLLKKVMPPYKPGDTFKSVVYNNYDQFDAQFVKLLNERVQNGDSDAKELLAALAVEQQKRIAAATEALKKVLALGEPMRMEGAIVKMAREGKIDEPFLLLLEANMNQALQAGASGPAQLMRRLRDRAMEENDKQSSSKEIRLLRKLLRTEDEKQREALLEEAFTPKEALIVPGTTENAKKVVDGEVPEQAKPVPDVPPPDFINACKAVLLNFGNLGAYDEDRGDLATRIKKLAAEAEVIATRIYGKGMTVREQQDRMWEDQTTSIFDLERMEIEAERMGEHAPWTNPNADDDMFLPGFDKDGRMQIGGR